MQLSVFISAEAKSKEQSRLSCRARGVNVLYHHMQGQMGRREVGEGVAVQLLGPLGSPCLETYLRSVRS